MGALSETHRDALERIFWATLGHVEDELGEPYVGTDWAVKQAFASMTQDAEPIAREIGAEPDDVKALLAENAEPYADVTDPGE